MCLHNAKNATLNKFSVEYFDFFWKLAYNEEQIAKETGR